MECAPWYLKICQRPHHQPNFSGTVDKQRLPIAVSPDALLEKHKHKQIVEKVDG